MRKSSALITAAFLAQVCSAAGAQNQGQVDGTSVGNFFGSGAIVNPMDMERASIPADNFVNMPPWHNVKLPKPGQPLKQPGFMSGVGRAFAHTCNFIGFPVGDDHDVDASLSSDLQNEENQITLNKMRAEQAAEIAEKKAEKQQEKSEIELQKEVDKQQEQHVAGPTIMTQ